MNLGVLLCLVPAGVNIALGGNAVFPGDSWETRSPADLGLDEAKLDQLAQMLGGRGCVIKDGYVVKTWGDQAKRGDWFSSAKPVLSTMLFFAIEEGLVKSVDQRVADFGWEFNTKDQPMTFRQLGAMTSGYARPEPPGAAWSYNDYAIQLYQKTLFDKVFKEDPNLVCESPQRLGALHLQDGLKFSARRRISASVRDWARICWLWMNRGNWAGRQVLPRHYFDDYMKPDVPATLPFSPTTPTDDYLLIGTYGGESFRTAKEGPGIHGFNWWFNGYGPAHPHTLTWPDAPPDTVMTLGYGGNNSAIIPSLGMVICGAKGDWDVELEPGNPNTKINRALKLAAAAAANEPAYYPPPDNEGGWRTLNNADEIRRVAGMDKAKLDEAFDIAANSSTNGGLVVIRKGWMVYEKYFGHGSRETLCELASCGKSFTSIAIGILMAEHPDLFPDGLDQKIYTPAYLPAEAFPLSDPGKADIKLGQLLCFTAGIRGNNPCYIDGQKVRIDPAGPDGPKAMIDEVAFGHRDTTNNSKGKRVSTRTLWCKPGGGYSYASCSAHLASIIVRHVAGMELEDYVRTRLANPMGWGQFGYGYKMEPEITHTPGGGAIMVRPTDMARFGYLLLRGGRWKGQQVVPAAYVRACGRKSVYNPHYPFSLLFDVNTDGQISYLPRDAFFKGGFGGHVFWVIPSLDLVVWRWAGGDNQYEQANTGRVLPPEVAKPSSELRAGWAATIKRDAGTELVIKKVIESITDSNAAGAAATSTNSPAR